MIGFLIGIFLGAVLGVTVMALMTAAAQSDRHIDHINSDK